MIRHGGSKWFILSVLFLSLFTSLAVSASGESDSADPPLPEITRTILVPLPHPSEMARAYGPGEQLTYAVKFGPVRAGTAQLTVVGIEWANGARCYRLRSTVKSSRGFSTLFPVNDLTESWMDVEQMVSRRFVRIIQEGSYRKNEAVQIDTSRHLAYYYPKGDTVSVTPGAQDVLSILYIARGLDLDVGQGVLVPGHVDRKNANVELKVLKRERVTVPAGTFDCNVVEPLLKQAGLSDGRLTLWVSNDAKRIPVIMKSRVKVGSITAMLESYRAGAPVASFGMATH